MIEFTYSREKIVDVVSGNWRPPPRWSVSKGYAARDQKTERSNHNWLHRNVRHDRNPGPPCRPQPTRSSSSRGTSSLTTRAR